jgi:hypothetical protein
VARNRHDSARPAHPQVAAGVLGQELNFVAGQPFLRRELSQMVVLEKEQAHALRADPHAPLPILVQRPDLLSAQAIEQRIAPEFTFAEAA